PKLAVATGGRRSSLARWLTLSDHPLTARVIVNRLWQHHFGKGIVATSNDFGSMGDDPSHAQLLDWLACELVDRGWSLKAIHRLMVLSATYQQSSQIDPGSPVHQEAMKKDPLNKLLWHTRRRRLDGEVVRDSLYAVSGRLHAQVPDDAALICQAWLQAYGRPPTDEELVAARQFLTAQAERIYADEADVPIPSQPQPCPSCLEPHKAAAYVDLCHALMNS